MKQLISVILVVLIFSTLIGFAFADDSFSFSATDADGTLYDEKMMADSKVVLLNFWEPWCGPCVQELPALERLYEEYKDDGLLIIGVYSDQNGAQTIIQENGITYPMLLKSQEFSVFDTGAVPTSVFMDSTGKILPIEAEDVKQDISGILHDYVIAYANGKIDENDPQNAELISLIKRASEDRAAFNKVVMEEAEKYASQYNEENSLLIGSRDYKSWEVMISNRLKNIQ